MIHPTQLKCNAVGYIICLLVLKKSKQYRIKMPMQASKVTRKGIRIGSATAPKCSRYYLRQKSILLMSIFWQKAINMLLLFFSSILSLSFSWSRFIGRTLFWWVMESWVLFSDRSLESNCATASSSSYKQHNNKDQSDTILY